MFLGLAASAPSGHPASGFCQTIDTILELAQDDFRTIESSNPASGTARKVLPGADSCEIRQSGEHPGYWCTWPSTRATLARHVEAFANQIGDCLDREPEWTSDEISPSAFILASGVEFYVSGSDMGGGMDLVLAVEFVGDEDGPPVELVLLTPKNTFGTS